jgi:hypothetical protein
MDRKKELKEQYKQMKPDMGIFIIRSKFNDKCYIEATQNVRATLNGTHFKLEAGNHPNRELQKEWKEHGKENFIIEVLEKLEYDKDEIKTDYSDDLALLLMEWEEKFAQENLKFYKK